MPAGSEAPSSVSVKSDSRAAAQLTKGHDRHEPVPGVVSMPSSNKALAWNSDSALSSPAWVWLRQNTQ